MSDIFVAGRRAVGLSDMRNLVDLLRWRSETHGDKLAFAFLQDGEKERERLVYRGLDARARAIAATLQRSHAPGERALLLYAPGLAYIEAFFGCLYAGVIAVPAYPPNARHKTRLTSISQDASPSVVLTTSDLSARIPEGERRALGVSLDAWISTDLISTEIGATWRDFHPAADSVAFLQYTSGSTADPKGVIVSHANLINNEALIAGRFAHDASSSLVGWLPLYHDMGLIGNVLQPLYVGAAAYLMSPNAFLEKPIRWLRAISTYRAHTSGGPNFGFDHCVARIKPEEKEGLDLSTWRVAFSGAEPVRARTLDRFAEAFASAGFERSNFFPCYGLAEATLVVTAPSRSRAFSVRQFDRSSLEVGRATPSRDDRGIAVVGCGRDSAASEVVVVNPETKLPCSLGEIGEFWIRGACVAQGYWRRAEETVENFQATIAGGDGKSYLRTGDLGFLADGEAFVVGRRKDLIIIAGRNFHPADIERAVEERVTGLRAGGVTSFSIDGEDAEELVVIAEVERKIARNGEALRNVAVSITGAVASDAGVEVKHIALIIPGSLAKTSSGKLRRSENRRRFLNGDFKLLNDVQRASRTEAAPSSTLNGLLRQAFASLPPSERARLIESFLLTWVPRGPATGNVSPQSLLADCGVFSLRALELKHALEDNFGIDAPLDILLSDRTIAAASQSLALSADVRSDSRIAAYGATSASQRAIWTVHQLDPQSPAYNLHFAFNVARTFDIERFQRALLAVIEAHPQLRSVYRSDDGDLLAEALPMRDAGDYIRVEHIADEDLPGIGEAMSVEAKRPFDLQRQPPLRVVVYRSTDAMRILFVAHHIAVDLWSFLLIIRKLNGAYERPDSIATSKDGYEKYIAQERHYLQSAQAEVDWLYWKGELEPLPPVLELPYDDKRPELPGYDGASELLRVDRGGAAAIQACASRVRTTPFSVLLAAYFLLLYRSTGQTDIVVGAPTAGRLESDSADVVGNYVNPLAIRLKIDPAESFVAFVARVRDKVNGAITHQRFPFAEIVDRLRPDREGDALPIYKSWFVLQQAQAGEDAALASLALGETLGSFDFCGADAQAVKLQDRVELFDLKAMAAEIDGEYAISFQYRTQLLGRGTVLSFLEGYRALLQRAVHCPSTPVGDLSLLSTREYAHVVSAWNETQARYSDDKRLHDLFEDQVAKAPESVAVAFGKEQLTYGELDRLASAFAARLQAEGCASNRVVAVCLDRSIDMIVSLLGVLKAGAAYLPIDPDYPRDRIALLLKDAAPILVVTSQSRADVLPAGARIVFVELDTLARQQENLRVTPSRADDIAYVIYTSGSTGDAKGVMVPHRGVVNRMQWMQKRFELTSADVVLQKTPYTFDVSVWELFWPLVTGAKLVFAAPGDHTDPTKIAQTIVDYGVTTVHFVPTMLSAFLANRSLASLPSLKRVCCSGEELPASLAKRFFSEAHMVGLHNLYGPTEASIDVTAFDCARDDDRESVAIGKPIDNTQIFILNSDFEPTPIGAPGELFIGGVGLARCYIGQASFTAERFIPNPFSDGGARLYRTGDIGRFREDGNIEFLRRNDRQVKIRGFRIELGEIEAALRRIHGVRDAVVLARSDKRSAARLVAYLVGERNTGAIIEGLGATLPEYMLPSAYVWLDRLPLTSNGKVDRKALPEPDAELLRVDDFEGAATDLEAVVCAIFADVLEIGAIGATDDFFRFGGDSVRAIQVGSRLAALGYEIAPRDLFAASTPRMLADRLIRVERSTDRSAEQADKAAPFALAGLEAQDVKRICESRREVVDIYPLTPMQEGMLFHSLSMKGSGLYHMQERYEITGAFDIDLFADAWRRVVDRHDVLRTSFEWDTRDGPRQVVQRAVELPIHRIDISHLQRVQQDAEIDRLLSEERSEGFDLSSAPLLRIWIIKTAADRHICVRSFHHLIMDDWCTSPLLLEVRRNYAAAIGFTKASEDLPVTQFRDFIRWSAGRSLENAEAFWRQYLEGFTEPTPIGLQSQARGEHVAHRVADAAVSLSRETTEQLCALASQRRLTVNTFVQGALALTLAAMSNVDEVVFGVTVAGRPVELAGVESALGLFINSLPLRVRIKPQENVCDWLGRILKDNLEIRQFEHVAQTRIQSWSEISRSDALLFQHLLTFENAPVDQSLRSQKDVLDINLLGMRVHTNYPLTFVALPGECLTLRLTYDAERFAAADVERLALRLSHALEQLVDRIDSSLGALELVDEEEKRRLTVAWNRTDRNYAAPTDLVERFEMQAAAAPNAIAARCCGKSLTYRALNEDANRLAQTLLKSGVATNQIVVLLQDRSEEFLVSMLAIFKAGAAYLPIDPSFPDNRIVQILHQSRAHWLLSGDEWLDRARRLAAAEFEVAPPTVLSTNCSFKADLSIANPVRRHGPRGLAFIIYTSGSTGQPKGVMVEHRGMYNNLITKVDALGLTAKDVIAQSASQSFDISVWQFLTGIAIGARIEIFPDAISKDPSRLIEEIGRCGVTILETVPSMIRALLDAAGEVRGLEKLRWLMPCGEAFTPELCRRFMRAFPAVKLLNAYGPAECSDDVSYHFVEEPPGGDDLSVPIGRPVDNTKIYVLNQWGDLAPAGVAGEICVGGLQVGQGYLDRPDLTAKSFIPDSFGPAGSVLYRTGDLGRVNGAGVLEFLGRVDNQVKIRGHRIELGEIESCLVAHPAVQEACVVARQGRSQQWEIVAYVVAPGEAAANLRGHVVSRLPDFMAPSAFVLLETLPVSANGKIDRKRLPAVDLDWTRPYVAPRNEAEETLCAIWAEVLGLDRVGVDDNFFELGGHSLLIIQLRSKIRRTFDVELPLQILFEAVTVSSLAMKIEEAILAEIEAMEDADVAEQLHGVVAAQDQ